MWHIVKTYIFNAAVVAAIALPVPAIACEGQQNQPTQTKTIFFEKDSAALSSKSVLDLAEWAIDMKQRYPIQDWTNVVATAAPSEHNAKNLASRRAEVVKGLATQFGLAQHGLEVHSYVDSASILNNEFSMSGQIHFSPGCEDNCCKKN